MPQKSPRRAGRPIRESRVFDCYLRARLPVHTFFAAGPGRALELIDLALAAAGPNALLSTAKGEVDS